jgi:hypothetical protein
MSEGALNLVNHVLPDVPVRQFVLTVPFLRKTFGFEIVCQKCHSQLGLIALIRPRPSPRRSSRRCTCRRRSLNSIPRALHAHLPVTRAAATTG